MSNELHHPFEDKIKDSFVVLPKQQNSFLITLGRTLSAHFNLRDDMANDEEINSRLRDAVKLRAATLLILIFAIFIASVGLNVNSTAIIIGAMLISPLMGPIMGAGLGVAVYDFELVRRSLTNLGIATVLSLFVSALYFSLTPLQQAQSEILARTSPTLWDVLIAMFGGFAGIVGITRKEKSNVIPGVAIATALMPPICTAGFGLATGQWRYFTGALYLYTINCVFISVATVVGIRLLKVKQHSFSTQKIAKRVKASLLVLAFATALPSIYLALDLVRDEVFKSKANAFVAHEFILPNAQVVNTRIDPDKHLIDISLVGDRIGADTLRTIETRLISAGLEGTKIILHQIGDNQIDVTELKSSLLADLLRESQNSIKERDVALQRLNSELAAHNAVLELAENATHELRQLYPEVSKAIIGEGIEVSADGSKRTIIYLNITTRETLPQNTVTRIENWFKVRTKSQNAMLHFDNESYSTASKKPSNKSSRRG